MKYRSVATIAAIAAAGGLALSGCASNTGSTSASGAGVTTQAGGAPSTGTNAPSTTAAAPAATAASGTTAAPTAAAGTTGKNAGGSDICQAHDLSISLSGQNNVSGQVIQWIQLSNTTAAPCTMDGFAGVDLIGVADGQSNYDWPLGRDSEKYAKVTLQPGEAAYFGIKYLPWAAGDGTKINVTKIRLTPPNTTTTVTLSFTASVLLQDAATHPGTYLMPIALGRLN